MYVTLITAPSAVITWAEAQAHLRLDGDEEQTLVVSLIAGATAWIDGPGGWLGRSVGTQTLEARFDAFDGQEIVLPFGPIRSITTIKYLDVDGVEQTLASGTYTLLTDGRIRLDTDEEWPDLYTDEQAIRIRYEAGYATVPADIKIAILLLVGHWFANRETVITGTISSALPFATEALLSTHRVWSA